MARDLNIYVVTTAKGPAMQKAAGYFLIEMIIDGVPETKEGRLYREKTTGTDLTLQLLCNALYIISKSHIEYDTLVIATKEPLVESAFAKKWIEEWKSNEWKNKRGMPIAHTEDWQQLCQMLEGLSHRYLFSSENTSYFHIMERWSQSYLKFKTI